MAFSPTGRMMESRSLYRAWLTRYFSTVSLAGLTSEDEPILLRKIYVPLVLTEKRIEEHAPEENLHEGGAVLPQWLSSTKPGSVFMKTAETSELTVCRMSHSAVEDHISILEFHYLIGSGAGIDHRKETHELGLFTTEEMERCFVDAGLDVVEHDPEGLIGRGLFVASAR